MSDIMISKPSKAPSPETVAVIVEPYDSDARIREKFTKEHETRVTVSSVCLTAPDGGKATAFLALRYHNGAWRAEVTHDATDYATDRGDGTPVLRRLNKSVRLRFFKAEQQADGDPKGGRA